MSSSSQAPQAVPVNQLGLSADEVAVLQHAQREAAAGGSSSSRAASRASSQGLLILDSSSLAQLGRHFDRLMQQISQQLDHLTEQSQIVTMAVYDEAGNLMDNCDVEIRRFHSIMAQIDDLEVEFDRIRHIRDIVRGYRQRLPAELVPASSFEQQQARTFFTWPFIIIIASTFPWPPEGEALSWTRGGRDEEDVS
ncbi:hypothetical protein Daus18300_010840 [Diaporthe australafricana]|uniref:Biogenesis of lysosome-related organelles complex 1 subunit CNL1 n=1 Tax=Diaporthe australafricana TaxID=127596 RepID=A0ABR3W9G4_9PEZI